MIRPKPLRSIRRPLVAATTVALTSILLSPAQAYAVVQVDQTELAQGENAVGGGRATLNDSQLEMADVTAGELYTDEDLSVQFSGGNSIEDVVVAGSAEVDLSFSGENEVEEVHATEDSDVTINATGNNEFEEVEARDNANLTINVTGENEFEEISGTDDASITIRGTDCQKRDTIELGDDEDDTQISVENGNLTIDHVTVDVEAKKAVIGSKNGNVLIDTSKIDGDDNENIEIVAGGTLKLTESVVDIAGTIHSTGRMIIKHSDVDAICPDESYEAGPYRIWSEAGITLVDEKNGKVLQGLLGDKNVSYVDTNDGEDVHLEAEGDPAYYGCDDGHKSTKLAKTGGVPKTGDPFGATPFAALIDGGLVLLAGGLMAKREA